MRQYHKIENVFKRDEKTHKLIPGAWKTAEFEYLKDLEWDCTEKIDGTNIRVLYNDSENPLHPLEFRGRTDMAQIPPHLHQKLGEMFNYFKLQEVLEDTPACLYGEGYGVKIQKDGGDYIPDGVGFILIDIRIGRWWIRRVDLEEIARKLEIPIVPLIDRCTLCEAVELVRDGFDSQMRPTAPEGIVCKPVVDLLSRSGARIITKIKGRDFS